ncbi:peptidase C26 family protein [Pelomyxa schiedti]|nr:peptidase C26 family protein [Pelomyxa schiedti]
MVVGQCSQELPRSYRTGVGSGYHDYWDISFEATGGKHPGKWKTGTPYSVQISSASDIDVDSSQRIDFWVTEEHTCCYLGFPPHNKPSNRPKTSEYTTWWSLTHDKVLERYYAYNPGPDVRGTALVICNSRYTGREDAPGLRIEAGRVQNLFERDLNYHTLRFDDLTSEQMKEVFHSVRDSAATEGIQWDSIAVYYTGHDCRIPITYGCAHSGETPEMSDAILGVDNIAVSTTELLNLFTPSSLPLLKGKPKLIILNYFSTVQNEAISTEIPPPEFIPTTTQSRFPDWTDMVIAISPRDLQLAYADPGGTPYGKALIECLSMNYESATPQDCVSVLTDVHRSVADTVTGSLCVSSGSFTSYLSRKLPIVGIITEPSPSSIRSLGSEFICASYVKFVESSGARVAPIRYTDDEASLRSAVKNLNGLLFPGGGADLEGVYMNALTVLFDEALATNDAGEYFPIWGTCLGFEELLVLASGEDSSILDCDFDSENISMPVYFTSLAPSSRLWSPAPSDIYSIYENESVTLNNHVCGMTPAHFNSKEALTSFYDVLSTNYDRLGVEFISSIEGKNYPFYGVQWFVLPFYIAFFSPQYH